MSPYTSWQIHGRRDEPGSRDAVQRVQPPWEISRRMDLRDAINEFVTQGKTLCQRMRSPERTMVTEVHLTVLRAQLFLLEHEAVNLQKEIRLKQLDTDSAELGGAGTNPAPKRPGAR